MSGFNVIAYGPRGVQTIGKVIILAERLHVLSNSVFAILRWALGDEDKGDKAYVPRIKVFENAVTNALKRFRTFTFVMRARWPSLPKC